MRKWGAGLIVALLSCALQVRAEECRLAPRLAVVCSLPLNAARVWQAYGANPRAFDTDYVRASLHAAGCDPLEAFADYRGMPIRTARKARIATPRGWVRVTEIVRRNPTFGDFNAAGGFIADAYLRGDCGPDRGWDRIGRPLPQNDQFDPNPGAPQVEPWQDLPKR